MKNRDFWEAFIFTVAAILVVYLFTWFCAIGLSTSV